MVGSVATVMILGFALGMKHAVEADHVAAVATIVSAQRSVWRSSLVGILWGSGHTAALLAAGLVILTLRLAVPDSLVLALELLVGLVLVALGVQAMRQAARQVTIHRHLHAHDGEPHAHVHLHVDGPGHHDHTHVALPRRSFWVGLLHGLAGSGVLTVLVLAAVPSLAVGLVYILVFGLGSVLGMVLVSVLISLPIALAAGRYAWAHLWIQRVAGGVSLAVGGALIFGILRAALP